MNLHKLNRGKGDNRYCGPAVLSFLTGMNTNDAATLVRDLNPHIRAVRGLGITPLLGTVTHLGFDVKHVSMPLDNRSPTLNQWLKVSKKDRTAGRVFLVLAGRHYQLITGRRFACGIVGELVGLSDKRIKKRARVLRVYEISKNSG